MRIASIVINAVIFAVTAILVARCFRKDGRWRLSSGLKAFRYFTVLSNAFSGLAALAMLVSQLKGGPSPAALLFKHLGTVSVTVTLLTVLFFLGPTQGWRTQLTGRNLFMHLIGPLLAIVSYCCLEKRPMGFGTALLGVVPVLAYGLVYLYKVVFAPEAARWEDFYGFNRGGRWPVMFGAMVLGAAIVSLVLWLI